MTSAWAERAAPRARAGARWPSPGQWEARDGVARLDGHCYGARTGSRLVAPRSVAVVGASEDFGKFGGRVLHHLIKHGFEGRIVPVNPNRPEIFGLTAVPAVSAVGPVDVAVIGAPARAARRADG
jgi:hypothetical protein